MFEKSLQDKLKKIFDMKKVSFNHVGQTHEQECIFIEVESCKSSIKDAIQIAQVRGKLRVFATNDKLPYGYFDKKLQAADAADTHDLFFYDLEENSGYYGNLVERSMSFVYFFSSQHNPNLGTITSIELEYE